MKTKLFLLPLMACLFALVACEEKDYSSYPPTWKGFALSSNTVSPGDTLVVTALQDQKGRHIEGTKYTWKLSCSVIDAQGETQPYTYEKTVSTNYDGTDNGDPTFVFHIPDSAVAGRGTINFVAKYSYYGNGIQVSQGTTYKDDAARGYITSTSSTLYGGASGSVNFTIR